MGFIIDVNEGGVIAGIDAPQVPASTERMSYENLTRLWASPCPGDKLNAVLGLQNAGQDLKAYSIFPQHIKHLEQQYLETFNRPFPQSIVFEQ